MKIRNFILLTPVLWICLGIIVKLEVLENARFLNILYDFGAFVLTSFVILPLLTIISLITAFVFTRKGNTDTFLRLFLGIDIILVVAQIVLFVSILLNPNSLKM